MRNKIFAVSFCVIMLLVTVAAPIKRMLADSGVIEVENVGNIIDVEKVYDEDSFMGEFFNGVEWVKKLLNETYINYIPFYVEITSSAKDIQYDINAPVVAFLDNIGNKHITTSPIKTEDGYDVIEAESYINPDCEDLISGNAEVKFQPMYKSQYMSSDNSHRYYLITAIVDEDETLEFYCRVPSAGSDEMRPSMERQLSIINGLATARDDVNWYIYLPTCFEDTALCSAIMPTESKKDLFDDFIKGLDSSIQYDYVKINSAQDKYDKFFHTDHHWNCDGYLEGYNSIMDMIKVNYPDMVINAPTDKYDFPEIKFFGSNARAVGSYKIWDSFGFYDFNLPKHTLDIDTLVPYGGTNTFEEVRDIYLSGNYNKSEGYYHYVELSRIAKYIEYPENKTGRNLLLIGDSYSPPITEAIASYFDKTYVRYIDSNDLANIDYNKFVEENQITDVIMLEMSLRTVYNYYGDAIEGIYVK